MRPQLSIAFQTDKPLAAYGRLAARAEAYGFDGVSVYNDLLYQPAWLPLLEIARATSRVRLGPAAVNPFTCHPINIAGHIALLDEASDRRAYCGFARGAWLDFLGLHPPAPISSLREGMVATRHLLRRDKAPLPGDHFPLAGGETLRWTAVRPDIPFLLGSWGPRTISACHAYATEIKLGGSANPGAARWLKGYLNELGSGAGVVVGAVTVVDGDRRAARTRARREVALYLPVIADLDPSLTIEPDRLAGLRQAMRQHDVDTAVTFISDDLLDRFAFAGTPDDITAQIVALFAAGADRVELGTPHGVTPESGLALLGERVVTAVRRGLGP